MLNSVDLIGRIGKDFELRRTQNGKAVATLSLAVDRDFKNQSGEKETDWIDVTAWGQSAEYLSGYANKGDLIAVSGRLQVRQWQDKDGNKRYSTEVVANNAYIVRQKQSSQQEINRNATAESSHGETGYGGGFTEIDEQDGLLPF